MLGGTASNSPRLPVEVGTIYDMSAAQFTYSASAATTAPESVLTPPATPGGTASCANALKEIAYTVKVVADKDERDRAYLRIQSIQADLAVLDSASSLEVPVVEGVALATVQQKFSITFESAKLENDRPIQGLSGNPGYIVGLPLLVGTKDPAEAANNRDIKSVSPSGFKISGGDATGRCVAPSSEDHLDMGDPTLKFGVDLSYGCTKEMTEAELRTFCNGQKKNLEAEYELFSNLKGIAWFGEFGNANIYFAKVSPRARERLGSR